MMDVVFVTISMNCGGTERVISHLANYLHLKGKAVSIITFTPVSTDFYTLDTGIFRYSIGGNRADGSWLGKLSEHFRSIVGLRRRLRTLGPKVVISFLTTPNILTLIASQRLQIRRIICERNDPTKQTEINNYWRLLRRLLYPLADKITVNSKPAEQYFRRFNRSSKVINLPNPVLQCSVARLVENRTILFVGRLVYQKGLDVLLQALKLASCLENGWRVVIVGDGIGRESLIEQAKVIGISGQIIWRGIVRDIGLEYQAASIFVLPSRYEGTSNAMLEAMGAGLPTITTVAGASDIVKNGENGVVIESLSPLKLANAIDWLANDEELRRSLGQQAYKASKNWENQNAFEQWELACLGELEYAPE